MVPGQELSEPSATAVNSMAQTSSSTSTAAFPSTSAEPNNSQAAIAVCSANQDITAPISTAPIPLSTGSLISARPGSMVRVPEIANGRKSLNTFKIHTYFSKMYMNFLQSRECCIFTLSSKR